MHYQVCPILLKYKTETIGGKHQNTLKVLHIHQHTPKVVLRISEY